MHQERDSSPTSRDQQPPIAHSQEDEFRNAASVLDGAECFGGALWDAQLEQAFQSKQKLEATPTSEKWTVFKSCMHSLREGMAATIEQWAQKYVKLAAAYPQFSKCKPTDWARVRMQSIINRRLRRPDRHGAIAFCLMTMSGDDVEQRDQWRAPNWMYGSERACSLLREDPTDFVLRQEHGTLIRRLNYGLTQTLARLEVDLAIDAGQVKASGIHADRSEDAKLADVSQLGSESKNSRTRPGRPKDPHVANRRKLIRQVAAMGLKGEAYCARLDETGLHTPIAWQKRWQCPTKYRDAYNHPREAEKWRQRINNEKSKATSQISGTSLKRVSSNSTEPA
jgi:hypothetical protein